MQLPWPPVEKVPAGQAAGPVLPPLRETSLHANPAGHEVQFVLERLPEKVPGGQGRGASIPARGQYPPIGQASQAAVVAAPALKEPLAHGTGLEE